MKLISVKVRPAARAQALEELADGTWIARVKAPPADGRANEELVQLIAARFGLRRTQVRIRRGASGRSKLIELDAE